MSMNIITAVRRNHALEHATIAVLMSRLGPSIRLMGRAAPDGFHVVGNVSEESVADAAREGLARLKSGDHSLAVSPLCGTNLAAAGLLAGIGALLAMRRNRGWGGLHEVVLATTVGVVLGQPLGRRVQKHLTTSPEVEGMRIVGVTCTKRGKYTSYKVKTEQGW